MSSSTDKKPEDNSSKNKLGIEERIPTMPCVFNLNFRITRTISSNQGFTSYATHTPSKKASCPQCGGQNPTFYDHYKRKFKDADKEGTKRKIILTAKRYRCFNAAGSFANPSRTCFPNKEAPNDSGNSSHTNTSKTSITRP